MSSDKTKQLRDLDAFIAQSGAALPGSPQAPVAMPQQRRPAPPTDDGAQMPPPSPSTEFQTCVPAPFGQQVDISGIPSSPPSAAPLTSFNSLNSSPTAARDPGWPAPLGPAAFHGLAGEIVRMIEPHTEADPVALLLQLLTAFGNIIGRGAYIMADGARHHLNVFGVLVGATAKGRKGTSWNQIARLLKRVDPAWAEDRVVSGLSSGEGLIHIVRDKVLESKEDEDPDTEPGPAVKDQGDPDKRLLVIEGEYANVLKVMGREGNTLSPVIRQAWDGGTLRTLTKKSPGCATGAHISIIGHITRDEVLRLLTQTEAANGFGNRFLWAAVQRSKCLPEGGRIEGVNFNAIVKRLHVAIKFARNWMSKRRDLR